MKLIHNKKQLLIVSKDFQIGLMRLGKNKGQFKVRNLKAIRENCGEWSCDVKYFTTLKGAVNYAKTL